MRTVGGDRAVVLGAGIAGLLAARVLAEHFAGVLVIERDELPSVPQHRRGVPQGRHLHGLLPRGLQVFDEVLPGLIDALVGRGAMVGDLLNDVRWYLRGRSLQQTDGGLPILSASRPLLEAMIRDRVLALPNVSVRSGTEVVALCLGRHRVLGVDVVDRVARSRRTVTADLTVDATGRGSCVQRWLTEAGYPEPPADQVDIDLWYGSCLFARPWDLFGDDIMVVIAPLPGQRRHGLMQRIEGDRVLVTLAGIRDDRPPRDLAGFGDFAGSLPAPDIQRLISSGRPLATPVRFRCRSYLRRRYEQLADYPAGLLPIGDAMCADPGYAGGMSMAARSAMALADQLRAGGRPDAVAFFRAVSQILDAPWGSGVPAGRAGAAEPGSALTPSYLADLERAAPDDVVLSTAYARMAGLVDPPSVLLSDAIRDRVARVSASPTF
jgi:2-polyprenyl-6-methoxyphenol hydroxylase-like FAD-dependent oxidoreductase